MNTEHQMHYDFKREISWQTGIYNGIIPTGLPTTQSTPSPSPGLSILKMACHGPVDQHFSNLNVSANHLKSRSHAGWVLIQKFRLWHCVRLTSFQVRGYPWSENQAESSQELIPMETPWLPRQQPSFFSIKDPWIHRRATYSTQRMIHAGDKPALWIQSSLLQLWQMICNKKSAGLPVMKK